VSDAEPKEARYRSSARRILRTGEAPPNFRIFGAEEGETKLLITGGDKRLAAALRREALAAFEDEGPTARPAAR
ncbi:MAG TPA: hypothetical protein VJ715_17160, partial [Pyrinomonadaceae bacterium]|nr:hypothetical protein [Pyrinomonadaceae bacterium]